MAENAVYYLSEVPGIDAIAFGHAHAVFPDESFSDIPGVDVKRGTINGVVAVMPGRWGSHLGIMDLSLEYRGGAWEVVSVRSEARPIHKGADGEPLVVADQQVVDSVSHAHDLTRKFVNRTIGKTTSPLYSYLALVQDDPTVQIVNRAQINYVRHYVQGDPDLGQLPVLSVTAPFRAGGRRDNPNDYVAVDAGEITHGNAAELYPFPNRLVALKITGKEVREWLECSAALYNRVDPTNPQEQPLINWEGFRVYNFDVFEGVSYRIDVTEPARYDGGCNRIDQNASRIRELTYRGEPVEPNQVFLVATNNYRAFGGIFPGTGETNVAFESPDENRAIVVDYIASLTKKQGAVSPVANHNWALSPVETDLPLSVTFRTASGDQVERFVQTFGQYPMHYLRTEQTGFAVYRLDLAEPIGQVPTGP